MFFSKCGNIIYPTSDSYTYTARNDKRRHRPCNIYCCKSVLTYISANK